MQRTFQLNTIGEANLHARCRFQSPCVADPRNIMDFHQEILLRARTNVKIFRYSVSGPCVLWTFLFRSTCIFSPFFVLLPWHLFCGIFATATQQEGTFEFSLFRRIFTRAARKRRSTVVSLIYRERGDVRRFLDWHRSNVTNSRELTDIHGHFSRGGHYSFPFKGHKSIFPSSFQISAAAEKYI